MNELVYFAAQVAIFGLVLSALQRLMEKYLPKSRHHKMRDIKD